MILAIDFDGTIHDTQNRPPGRKMGLPIFGAKEALDNIKSDGNTIIIFTTHAGTIPAKAAVKDWLDHYNIPYDDITSTKPEADWYIDNKAIHFDTWQNVLGYLRVPQNAN